MIATPAFTKDLATTSVAPTSTTPDWHLVVRDHVRRRPSPDMTLHDGLPLPADDGDLVALSSSAPSLGFERLDALHSASRPPQRTVHNWETQTTPRPLTLTLDDGEANAA